MLAKGSFHIVAIPFVLAIFIALLWDWFPSLPFFAFGLLMLVFFRDPERNPGKGICSAADGVVREIVEEDGSLMVSIFMNVHNVHVNRAPLDGRVTGVVRKGAGRWPAFSKRADGNAKCIISMDTHIGRVRIIQIAGTFAWRVVPYVSDGNAVRKGERIGIIRFGSRVDLWLPLDKARCRVKVGDRLIAGVSTVAEVLTS